jgi:hypothetical protein
VPKDKILRFGKQQTISAIIALSSSGIFWHNKGVILELISYSEVPTPPSICYFTSTRDYNIAALGQPTPQTPPGIPSLPSPTLFKVRVKDFNTIAMG